MSAYLLLGLDRIWDILKRCSSGSNFWYVGGVGKSSKVWGGANWIKGGGANWPKVVFLLLVQGETGAGK